MVLVHQERLLLMHLVSLVQELFVFLVNKRSLLILVDDVLIAQRVTPSRLLETSLDAQLFEFSTCLFQDV